MKRRSRRLRQQAEEMNVTAFMNLMVILVPFLLITAVFSRMTILELNMASDPTTKTPPKQTLNLEVVVRDARIDVQDRNSGLLKRIPNVSEGYDISVLSGYLQKVKRQYPKKTDASILVEPDIAYDVLVKVMDAVRIYEAKQDDAALARYELFPEIAIGDAPGG